MSETVAVDTEVMLGAADAVELVRRETELASGADLRVVNVPPAVGDLRAALDRACTAWQRFASSDAKALHDVVRDTRLPALRALAADHLDHP